MPRFVVLASSRHRLGPRGSSRRVVTRWPSRAGEEQCANGLRRQMARPGWSTDAHRHHDPFGAFNALLADYLTNDRGLGWAQRKRGMGRNPPGRSPASHPPSSTSSRRARTRSTPRMIGSSSPTLTGIAGSRRARTIIKLRAQATVATRPDKTIRPLAELTVSWQVHPRADVRPLVRPDRSCLSVDPFRPPVGVLSPCAQSNAKTAIR